MGKLERLEELVPLIYEAALDRTLWPEVLRRFGEVVGAHCGALIRQNTATGVGQAVSVGIDPAALEDYFGYFGSRNVLLQRMGIPPPGLVYDDRDVLPKEELRKTEYFNDFLLARADVDSVLMGSLWVDERDLVAINLCRSPRREPFDAAEKNQLTYLVPHLQRAFALTLRLGTLETEARRGQELLDRAAHGMLVLDASGRILYANDAAERLIGAADGLYAGADGLAASTQRQTQRLREVIARTAEGKDGGAVQLGRPRCGRPLYVLATALAPESTWMQPAGRVLLLVRDPEPRPVLSQAHLSAIFGLTPAEARVALHLYQGEQPAAIAASLRISRHTARAQVNAVLRKTGARRQAELIRRLTMLAELADHRRRT